MRSQKCPPNRWDPAALYDPDPATPERMNTRWGAFLDELDQFDANFFGISPREAVQMDPQQRLLLEVAWEALEQAGQPLERLAGSRTGVFIGIHSQSSDYCWLQLSDRARIDAYTSTGTAHSIVPNRLSYFFDLQGPSLVVDTACSSSLVAVHLGCQSLRSKECNLVIAGGVNLILSPEMTIAYSKLGMMASDGRCKVFDCRADGFVRGEGCGVVVLKRLADARADGDPILAVVRGSAVNQDGHTNGLTAPNGLSQQAVLRQALDNAARGSQRDHLCRDPWNRHGSGRPYRGRSIGIRPRQVAVARPDVCAWFGENKPWPPGSRGGHRRPNQGGPGVTKRGDTTASAFYRAQSAYLSRAYAIQNS